MSKVVVLVAALVLVAGMGCSGPDVTKEKCLSIVLVAQQIEREGWPWYAIEREFEAAGYGLDYVEACLELFDD